MPRLSYAWFFTLSLVCSSVQARSKVAERTKTRDRRTSFGESRILSSARHDGDTAQALQDLQGQAVYVKGSPVRKCVTVVIAVLLFAGLRVKKTGDECCLYCRASYDSCS